MKWEVQDGLRCDVYFFGGVGFAGDRWHTAVRKGDVRRGEVPGQMVKSVGLVALLGTRFIFKSRTGDDWMDHPFRVVHFNEENTFLTNDRHRAGPHKRCIHIPDLDLLSHWEARHASKEEFFQQVKTLDAGTAWTFGRNKVDLKDNIAGVQIDRL